MAGLNGCGGISLDFQKFGEVQNFGEKKTFFATEPLFREGDRATHCYLVTSGCVKLTQLTPQGREVIVRFVTRGGMVAAPALLMENDYPVAAQAVKPTQVLAFTPTAFKAWLQHNPELSLEMLKLVFERLKDLQTRYMELSSEQAEQRIAKLILNLATHAGIKTPKGVDIDIPLSRQDIADHVGASMYTVSRTLSVWEKFGWLKSSRCRVTITDPSALARLEVH